MATTADIPHFNLPFQFGPNLAVVVEQDSFEDVLNCVAAILRTQIGERTDLPEFGIVDPTFQTQPVDTDAIIQQVIAQEPRATLLVEQNPDVFDELIVYLLSTVDQVDAEVLS